ncbi:hypothetical protein N9J18_02660 [Porticoccaceae bacterium]|nr:hypothetical protein [Porticoccaceae bacterium]
MISFDIENITKGIGVVTASLALIGGGYSVWDKFEDKDILTWAPDYFEITDGPINGEYKVTVAREKHRDDCTVTDFTLTVRDSDNIVHPATSSIGKFMGPASDRVDTFAYKMQIASDHKHKVAKGTATLIAYIDYDCPEGHIAVTYPDHANLQFNITE